MTRRLLSEIHSRRVFRSAANASTNVIASASRAGSSITSRISLRRSSKACFLTSMDATATLPPQPAKARAMAAKSKADFPHQISPDLLRLLVLLIIAVLGHCLNAIYHQQLRQISSRSECVGSERRYESFSSLYQSDKSQASSAALYLAEHAC